MLRTITSTEQQTQYPSINIGGNARVQLGDSFTNQHDSSANSSIIFDPVIDAENLTSCIGYVSTVFDVQARFGKDFITTNHLDAFRRRTKGFRLLWQNRNQRPSLLSSEQAFAVDLLYLGYERWRDIASRVDTSFEALIIPHTHEVEDDIDKDQQHSDLLQAKQDLLDLKSWPVACLLTLPR